MTNKSKLTIIKIVHTIIWIFFNFVIFYMLYAVIVDKIDPWLWIGYGLFILEGLTLFAFNYYCPLTILARKYSESEAENFDIFLPRWLARYNKTIYTAILGLIVVLTIYRILY